MKKMVIFLFAIGMMVTVGAKAQEIDTKKYEVLSDKTQSSSTSSEFENGGVQSTKKATSVKRPTKPKSSKSATTNKKASSSSTYRVKNTSKTSDKVRTIILREKLPTDSPPKQQQPVVYNDYRQWHYTYNYGENSPFGIGGNVIIDSVHVDSGGVVEKDDTCGRLRKKWTKAKWRKPLTEFKVYTLEHFQSDAYDPLSTKVDTSWIKRPFRTRTFLVYEKHLKNKCKDTIVRYDTCKKWWVATRRWGGIAILGGGLVALGDYACKNQYWGLLDGNFGQKSNGNNGNNGNDTSGTGTNYPTHKPGSTSGNKPGNTSQKPDVLPVTQKQQKPVQTFSTVVRQQEPKKIDLNDFLRKLPPTRVGVNISLDFKNFEPYITFCGVKALL